MLIDRDLSDTTFFAGPEEDLAAVDVYEVKDDAVINDTPALDVSDLVDAPDYDEEFRGFTLSEDLPEVVSKSSSGLGGLVDSVKSGAGSLFDKAKSLGSSALNAVGGLGGLAKIATSVAGPSLLNRLGSGGLTGIPGLPGGGLSSLTGLLGAKGLPSIVTSGLNLPIPNKLGTSIGFGNGPLNNILPSQLGGAYQMSSLINNVTGGANPISIVDRDSSSRLMSTLAMGGISSGISNSFSSLLPLAGGNRSIISSAATTCMGYSSKAGNIGAMKDIVLAAGKPAIASVGFDAMCSLSRCFTSSSSQSQQPAKKVQEDFTSITDTFSEIDNSWMKDTIGGMPAIDVSLAREGNEEFCSTMQKGALTTTDPDLKYFSMVSAFPPASPEEELRKNFPLTVTNIETNTTPNVEVVNKPTEEHVIPPGVYAKRIHGVAGGASETIYSDGTIKTVDDKGNVTWGVVSGSA